jgi:hypothetical protein
VGNERFTFWFENVFCRPLTEDKLRFDNRDEADFLTEEGQLRYDLNMEVEQFKFFGINTNVKLSHYVRINKCTSKSTESFTTHNYSRLPSKVSTLIQLTSLSILLTTSGTEKEIMISD